MTRILQRWLRRDGCGFHALAETVWRKDPGRPIPPTVNADVDAGGGLLIDWLSENNAMAQHVVADGYKVHVPEPGGSRPSGRRPPAGSGRRERG